MVTLSPPASPIFVGGSPELTCVVQLDTSVDVGVNVRVDWSGPMGAQFSVASSDTDLNAGVRSYTATTTVAAVTESDSGEYMCSAVVTSFSSSILTSATVPSTGSITIGKSNVHTYCQRLGEV